MRQLMMCAINKDLVLIIDRIQSEEYIQFSKTNRKSKVKQAIEVTLHFPLENL